MVNLLDLEYVIKERRAEVERDIRHEAMMKQLRTDWRVVPEFEPRRGLRFRLGLASERTRP